MSTNPYVSPCCCAECTNDSTFKDSMIVLFTKATAMRKSNLLSANYELNSKQYEDELGDDENARLLEGLSKTTKMEPGVTYMNKAGEFVQTTGSKKRSGCLYIIGKDSKYDALLAASEKDRSSAVESMHTACGELGFQFKGYIMEATRVHFFPGIVNLTYVGLLSKDLNRYMFEEDLGSFHPLFIVLPQVEAL